MTDPEPVHPGIPVGRTWDGRVQYRAKDADRDFLLDRARRMGDPSPHQQAHTELRLWRELAAAELRRIRLTFHQAQCITSIRGGWLLTTELAPGLSLVFLSCQEAFHNARTTPWETPYAERFDIDETALLDYLRTLGPAADHALRDALNRWHHEQLPATAEGFTQAGLQVVPGPAPTAAS